MQSAERRISVLVVDDHPMLREGVAAVLQLQDDMLLVGEAEDGAAAVALYRQLKPDIVLMDLQMPRMGGVEASRAIRDLERGGRRTGRTPILAVTANVMSYQLSDYAEAGMDGVVAKPLQMEVLLSEMQRVLAGPASVEAGHALAV